MITLNILPNEIKKGIKLKTTYLKLKNLYAALIIIAAIYGSVILAGKWLIEDKQIKTMEKSSLLSKSLDNNHSMIIKDLNGKIDAISDIQNEFISFSSLLNEMAKLTNEGIKMQNFSIGKDGNFSFAGTALSRNDLLLFKNNLENSDYFEKIDFPISNLTQQENVSFNLIAKIKSYEFKQ
jgi:hypothetical protein